MYRHVANSSRTARQLLPPARRRSTSSGVCEPYSLAWLPLGQRMTVPPGAWTRRAPGSALRMPPGPSYMEVTPSPRVGAMIDIQCGTGPGRHAGPLTCWRTYSAQAFDFPAPRPAIRSHPVQGPGGGIWWGCGCQRGFIWAPRRAAARAATWARSSVVMTGLSSVARVSASGSGVTSVGEACGVEPVMVPGPRPGRVVDDAGPGADAAEGELEVLAAHLDGWVAGEVHGLRQFGAYEDRDGRRVRAGRVEGSPKEHGERVAATDDAEPRVHVVRARLLLAGEELLDVVGVHLVVA